MKVCMLARSLPVHAMGGMELHIETLAESLAKLGVEVTLITTSHPDGKEYEEKNGVKIYYIKDACSGKYSKNWWKGSIRKFEELHCNERFDLIHSQSAGAYYLLRKKINGKYNIPVVVSLHGTSVDEIKTKLRLGFNIRSKLSLMKNIYNYLVWDRFYLRACDAIIATSDQQLRVIEKYFPVGREKLNLVYNGIDEELFQPRPVDAELVQKYNLKSGEKIILCVARLKKEKGVQNMITVLGPVLQKYPNTRLMIVGDGEYKNYLMSLSEPLMKLNKINFLGRVEYAQLPIVVNACTLFVNSTIRENGYDLTIPQAMACEKPVVVSDIRSVFSVVEDGKNGFVYPRNDLIKLRDDIIKVLGDEEYAGRIGKAARATVTGKFSLSSMTKGTIATYKKVIERQK